MCLDDSGFTFLAINWTVIDLDRVRESFVV